MSTGDEDRKARSVAIEQTYVHDVYDQMSALQYSEHRNTALWPAVRKFLNDLEPGSIVCDVGKYKCIIYLMRKREDFSEFGAKRV